MTSNYCEKKKEKLQKKHMKSPKIFLKKEKAKRVNMLVSDIEIVLKKKKK